MNRKVFHQFLYNNERLYKSSGEENTRTITGFAVLIEENEILSPEDSELLDKILASIGKTSTSIPVISAGSFKTSDFNDAMVLAFLESSRAEDLGFKELYRIAAMGTSKVLISPPLAELRESKEMKLRLWTELKKLQ